MRSIVFTERNRSDNLLHVETPLGIVNIRIGLRDATGRRVDSVEVIPNAYAGEPEVVVDGCRNTRMVEALPIDSDDRDYSDDERNSGTFAAVPS